MKVSKFFFLPVVLGPWPKLGENWPKPSWSSIDDRFFESKIWFNCACWASSSRFWLPNCNIPFLFFIFFLRYDDPAEYKLADLDFEPPSSIVGCITFVYLIILPKCFNPCSSAALECCSRCPMGVPPCALEFIEAAAGEFGARTTLYNLGFIKIVFLIVRL